MAFLGEVHTTNRISSHLELFVLDLPAKPRDLRISERGKPLSGSDTARPRPPPGTTQRRLTDTSARTYPGMCAGPLEKRMNAGPPSPRAGAGKSGGSSKRGASGPKFWPRSSPCGSRVCVVAMDDMCVPQLYLVATGSAAPARLRQLTDLPKPGVQSAFSWSPCGEHLAFVHDGSVCLLTVPRAMMGGDGISEGAGTNDDVGADPDDMMAQLMEQTNAVGGPEDRGRKRRVKRLTRRRTGDAAPAPRGVTFSPCGKYVAYVRREPASHGTRGGQQAQTPGSPGSASPKSPLDSEKGGDKDDPFYDSDHENEGSTKYFNQVCVVGVEVVLRQPFRLAAQVIGTGATVLGGLIATDLAKTGVGAIVDGLRHRRVMILRKIGRRGKRQRTDTWQDFQRKYEQTGRRLERKPNKPAAAKGWDDFKREYEQ